MKYIVRPYKEGEEQFVASLHKQLYAEEYSWGPSFIDYAVKIAFDFAEKEKNNNEELFVAESEGKLVGCIMLCQTEELSTGQLRLFAVDKKFRRCGIGKELINVLIDKAKDVGYEKLILWTASPLTAAIRHYEKLGFYEVETVENKVWHTAGDSLFEIKMEMSLQ